MFFKNIHRRIKIILLVVVCCFVLIVLRVFYIQVIDYKKLNKLSNALWNRNLPIQADRGRILTADNKVVADNLTTTSLVLIPNQIKNKEEVAKTLSDILKVSYEEILKHVSKNTSIERVHPEGRRLSYEIADKINSYKYEGVYLVKEAKRYYKNDAMLAHVLGYVGIDNQGLSGLELQYDDYLTGEDGAIKYYSDAKGNRLNMAEIYVKPQNGIDIQLTVNYDIQASIERELNNVVTKYNPDHALAIAMNPKTGEILGMSSRPNFDPNNYQDYSVLEINRNLPIWMTYEPGSTFNIVSANDKFKLEVLNRNLKLFEKYLIKYATIY